MCDRENLNTRHSYHTSESPKATQSDVYSKSDLNFTLPTSSATSRSSQSHDATSTPCKLDNGEYYKKYEHDEVPVKDCDSLQYERPFAKGSLTNSELDNLEKRIFRNVSQELTQTDEGSLSNLESNIKFFKTTVEKIFENFYTSMRDFEHYKRRFHEILRKSKEGSINDMEDFIKDMFEHIMSSDNSVSNISCSAEVAVPELEDKDACVSSCGDSDRCHTDNVTGFVQAYKNEHYLTDSTCDEKTSRTIRSSKIEDIFNIFLLGGNPCVEIKLDGRNLLSEVFIKEPIEKLTTGSIASADNLKKIAAKKIELEKYISQQYDNNMLDRDIPVKVSNAKKNIYLNEDFAHINENNETSKSFLSKICSILCKKFRKSSVS